MRKKKQTNKERKEERGDVKGWTVRAKWFCCAFKVGFHQLICEASLIFKLNSELALSIILKERELCESEHLVVECRCLKIWDLSALICSSILVLKWWQVLPI